MFAGSYSWGENIAYYSVGGVPGILDEVDKMHTNLMNSPGHRANILNTTFDQVGVGLEIDVFNGKTVCMCTQNFASSSAE